MNQEQQDEIQEDTTSMEEKLEFTIEDDLILEYRNQALADAMSELPESEE